VAVKRYILVCASMEKERIGDTDVLTWLRWTIREINATGLAPSSIFYGTDRPCRTTASLLAGGIESINWTIACQAIGKWQAPFWNNLKSALMTSEDAVAHLLCPNPPRPIYHNTEVFGGDTGIIVHPSGLGDFFLLEHRGYALWPCGGAYILEVGRDWVEMIPGTIPAI
jgi:hypothetical protein